MRKLLGALRVPKGVNFLPIQSFEKNEKKALFDLQTVAFGVEKEARKIADSAP